MRRCVTCEGLLEDSLFPNDGPVCKSCVIRLQKVFNVEYAPPERKTVKEAYTSLVIAIRDQAERDGELDDWEEYWLETEEWARVWAIMQAVYEQSNNARDNLHHNIGGLL